jgi:multidrug efflux system outer membrane protein
MIDRHSRAGAGPILLASLLLLGACTFGPDYKRPDVELPVTLGVAQSPNAPAPRWWSVFGDPVLDALVDEALERNRDLRAAAERIEQARAQLGITRAAQFPSAGVEATRSRDRASQLGSFPIPAEFVETDTNRLVLRASWELDFWGKYRRATEAARATLAASQAGRDSIRASLIGEVARGYFTLRALDRRLDELARTLEGRRESLGLQQLRFDGGVISEVELRQVESELRATEAAIPAVRQARTQQEGALAVLLGRSPRAVFEAAIARGEPHAPAAIEVPAGLPSDLLLRRPDLREAEQRLHAANAGIGVARAAYFPSISLTGFFGGQSQNLDDLFSGPARTWSLAAGALQPLFAAGQIRGGVDLASARTREAAEAYQHAIANAFREVRDALGNQSNAREAAMAHQARVQALTRTYQLQRLRYDNGAVGLFEVLETERQLIGARLEAIDAERDRTSAIVDLYLALGA